VLCHNPEQAERDRHQRTQQLALAAAELERNTALRAKHLKAAGKRYRGADDHLKGRARPARPPRPGPLAAPDLSGRLAIDRTKLKAEAQHSAS
jgi:hypothetical protein